MNLWTQYVKRSALLVLVALLASSAGAEPSLDPKALELLKDMSAKLASAKTMRFTAVTTYESPTALGPPLAYGTISEVTLQRPDKLRVVTPGDGPASEFLYDGKTMMALAPAENLVAVAEAPPTLDAAFQAAHDLAAIYFPFTDAIVADPYAGLTAGIDKAYFIGQSRVVGGTTTDMVALSNGHVFQQIWIGSEDKLPRAMRAVYADDPSMLRHHVEFSNWRLDGKLTPDMFTLAGAEKAQRIPFARPDPKPPAEALVEPKDAAPPAEKK